MGTGNETRTGSGRAQPGLRRARNSIRVVNTILKTGETWAETEKNVARKRWFRSCLQRYSLENSKEERR